MNDNIQPEAMFKFSYGLYVLSASCDGKDNGCIINTAVQLTDTPKQVAIAVNKANLTHDMIFADGRFNLSFLSEQASFDLFKRFGFQSGRNADKFDGIKTERSLNGLVYLPEATNGFLSGKVTFKKDAGTHTLFIADVTEAKVLSAVPSVTYAYYFANIKPKPPPPRKSVGFAKSAAMSTRETSCPRILYALSASTERMTSSCSTEEKSERRAKPYLSEGHKQTQYA